MAVSIPSEKALSCVPRPLTGLLSVLLLVPLFASPDPGLATEPLIESKADGAASTVGEDHDLAAEQILLKEKLLAEARSSPYGSEAMDRVVALSRSRDKEERELARLVLLEVAEDENAPNAVRALGVLGSNADERVKRLALEIIENRPDYAMVRSASETIRHQELTDEEALLVLRLARGLDNRVHRGRAMHGPELEGQLLASLAVAKGPAIYAELMEYLDKHEQAGLYDYRSLIISRVNTTVARRVLFAELKEMDLTQRGQPVGTISALTGSFINELQSDSPERELVAQYVDFLVGAVESETVDEQVKEVGFLALARLLGAGIEDEDSRLRNLMARHEDFWKSTRTAEFIERPLRQRDGSVSEAALSVDAPAEVDQVEATQSDSQIALQAELLEAARLSPYRSEAFERVISLSYSLKTEERDVARRVLLEIAKNEDSANAAGALGIVGSKPDERVKRLALEIIENRPSSVMVQSAATAIRHQELTDEEALSMLRLARGLDNRVHKGRWTHGPMLESHLLSSLAAAKGPAIYAELMEYLQAHEQAGLLDYRSQILGSVNTTVARRDLFAELKEMDLSQGGRPVGTISALTISILSELRSESPDRELVAQYVEFLVSAVESETVSQDVKEEGLFAVARLLGSEIEDEDSRLRNLMARHEEFWKVSRRAALIERQLRQREMKDESQQNARRNR